MELNYISSQVIRAAINVHKELGPGLLESVYQICIVIELNDIGMRIKSEVPLLIILFDKNLCVSVCSVRENNVVS